MTNTDEAVPIEYGVYTSSYEDEMATLLGEVFARRDPLAFGAGVTPKEFEAFVRLFLPKANAERLTIVARLANTGHSRDVTKIHRRFVDDQFRFAFADAHHLV